MSGDFPVFAIFSKDNKSIIDFQHDESEVSLEGVAPIELPEIKDDRGSLLFGEFAKNIPFEVKRFFSIYDVQNGQSRGNHAHKECKQFVMCISGEVDIVCDNGHKRVKFKLSNRTKCLSLSQGIWTSLFNFSQNAIVIVFTSHFFSEEDYLRDYTEYKDYIKNC